MTLVYTDSSIVDNLPDGFAKFTIKGYRDYLDPIKKYERLRLYLVDTGNIHKLNYLGYKQCLLNNALKFHVMRKGKYFRYQ